jgi:hypothetical protein
MGGKGREKERKAQREEEEKLFSLVHVVIIFKQVDYG